MLNKQRDSLEDVVFRLADCLIQGMNNCLVLHHDLRWGLQMSEPEGHKVVFFYARELGNNPHNSHLGHQMILLVFFMIDSHQCANKVKLGEELVDSHSYSFKRVHSIVVLDQLVMRSAHPREAEKVAESWINEHRKYLSRNFMNCGHVAITRSLKHLA